MWYPPPPSSSPLDALLSAISPSLLAATSPPSHPSLSSTSPSSLLSPFFSPPTPARILAFDPPPPSTIISTPLRRTHSSPPILDVSPAPSTYSERQRDVVASVMAGIDYDRYRLQEVMRGGTPVSKDTWYAHQSTVYNSIIQIAESKEVEYLQMLRATGQRLVFCADAAWSHRGYEANQCCWLLLNAENKQIALAVILTKSRWEKGAGGAQGQLQGQQWRDGGHGNGERHCSIEGENGLLPLVQGWVCDKDSSVSEQLKTNPDTAHIPIHYDPGHIKKELPEVADGHLRYKVCGTKAG